MPWPWIPPRGKPEKKAVFSPHCGNETTTNHNRAFPLSGVRASECSFPQKLPLRHMDPKPSKGRHVPFILTKEPKPSRRQGNTPSPARHTSASKGPTSNGTPDAQPPHQRKVFGGRGWGFGGRGGKPFSRRVPSPSPDTSCYGKSAPMAVIENVPWLTPRMARS